MLRDHGGGEATALAPVRIAVIAGAVVIGAVIIAKGFPNPGATAATGEKRTLSPIVHRLRIPSLWNSSLRAFSDAGIGATRLSTDDIPSWPSTPLFGVARNP